ncbi:MAG: YbhB/YbcL family Raf kinase inhibitor-like protein [Acidobacteria bacterium]|nr:YbhB/YbcL family Raf kinase inhibitor-like protein [Acidobacteriota bacterium]
MMEGHWRLDSLRKGEKKTVCAARRNQLTSRERFSASIDKPFFGPPGLHFAIALSIFLISAASCNRSSGEPLQAKGPQVSGFQVESTAFKAGEEIPKKFTCEGEDISPALRWTHPPRGTRSFALITEDPDAPSGTWIHWVVYDLPAQSRELSEGVPKQQQVSGGGSQGRNDFGRIGYGGPCPPPGGAHHYFFKIYALDTMLHLQPGVTKEEVLQAAKGHILGVAELMALFKR